MLCRLLIIQFKRVVTVDAYKMPFLVENPPYFILLHCILTTAMKIIVISAKVSS